MAVFFTADTHFFHHNIIKYCRRPFATVEKMNDGIIARWNGQVGKNDRVYHLGDVSFGGLAETFRVLAELNGEICLILGNHDDELAEDPYIKERFTWMKHYHEACIEGQNVVMCHYPILQWRNAQRGSWHLHGHTHGALQLDGAALDVGLDARPDFQIWTWREVCKRLSSVAPLPYPQK